MRTAVVLIPAVVTLSLAALEGTARAHDPVAETLYEEGRKAAEAQDWTLACRKFRESQDREPAPGTLLNLANCEEHLGQLVEARAHFEAGGPLLRPGDDRIAYARQRASALALRIPTLTLRLGPAAPSGTRVLEDGTPVENGGIGSPISLDPGDHVVVVQAPGRTATRTSIHLDEGQHLDVTVAPGPAGSSGQEAQGVGGASAPTGEQRTAPSSWEPPSSALRTGALVSFGVGAVGLGLGIAGGLITMGAKSTTDNPANCSSQYCNQTGQDAETRGKTWSAVSTAGFVVAGVGAATGVTLWLLSSKRGSATGALSLRPSYGGAGVWYGASF